MSHRAISCRSTQTLECDLHIITRNFSPYEARWMLQTLSVNVIARPFHCTLAQSRLIFRMVVHQLGFLTAIYRANAQAWRLARWRAVHWAAALP